MPEQQAAVSSSFPRRWSSRKRDADSSRLQGAYRTPTAALCRGTALWDLSSRGHTASGWRNRRERCKPKQQAAGSSSLLSWSEIGWCSRSSSHARMLKSETAVTRVGDENSTHVPGTETLLRHSTTRCRSSACASTTRKHRLCVCCCDERHA